MSNRRKRLRTVAIGIAGIITLTFLILQLTNLQYRKSIPVIPKSSSLSVSAKNQIQDAYRTAKRKPSAKNLGELGMIYHSCAQYDQAAQCYKLAVRKNISDWKWSYYLGYLNMELGKPDEVIENFSRVIEIHPDADHAWYYMGEAYHNLGENNLAEDAYSRIIEKRKMPEVTGTARKDHFPLNTYAMFRFSKIYFDSGRLDLAENTLIGLLQQSDGYGPAFRLLGNIYKMKGEIAQGEEYITRANDLFLYSSPVDTLVDALALMSRSELYLLKQIDEAKFNGYIDWAVTLVNHAMKYIPENKNLISKAIKIYLAENMSQNAALLKDQHINYFINNYAELASVGMLFFQKGMYEESKEYWEQVLTIKSGDTDTYKYLAMCLLNLGERQKARELINEALAKYQDDPAGLAEIIFLHLQFANMEETNKYLRRLNRLKSNNPKVLKLYGKINEINGDLTTAISMYLASFRGNPKDVETIRFLDELFMQKEMWDQYIPFYKEVIIYHPNNPEFLEKLGAVLIFCPEKSFRDLDEGIKYSIRAFSHKNSPPKVVLSSGKNLSIALARKGDKQNALKTIQRTVDYSYRTNASEEIKQELEQLYRTIRES